MTFAAVFATLVGVLIVGQWGVSLAKRQVPELQTEPWRIAFHLAGEFLTAVALIVAGIGLLFDADWGAEVFLAAVGMLFYTVIVSPGYFAQKGAWHMVVLFGVLFIAALAALVLVLVDG